MADKNLQNPLDELYTNSKSQVEPAALAAILKPFLRINRENMTLLFTPAGMKLTANNKIILFLLARKAMHLQGLIDSDVVAPKEIKAELVREIPSGTIDVGIKRLSEKGPLKGQNGKYFIPDFNFSQVEEIFSKVNS